MKKITIWSMLMLMTMVLPFMTACGGDDDNSTSQKVDGVNVITGKRISELHFYENNEDSTPSQCYKILYDSQGRMSKIQIESISYDYSSGKIIYVRSGNYYDLAVIDYDLRVITIPKRDNRYDSFGFSLNNDGYISQIGECSFTYDANGYLTNVDNPSWTSTLAYDNNEIIKAMTSRFSNGRTNLYYVTYGNVNNKGELYTLVNCKNGENNKRSRIDLDEIDAICFIVYQSGLFGKVVNFFFNLKDKNMVTELFKYNSGYYNYSNKEHVWDGKMTFVYQ